jgi:AmmeMemoRadiSam system protein A
LADANQWQGSFGQKSGCPEVSTVDITSEEQLALLHLARTALAAGVVQSPLPSPELLQGKADRFLQITGGAFVTLTKRKMLRGCIGLIESEGPLVDTIIHMAAAAGMEDPRFPTVRAEELDDISIEISILTPMEPVVNIQEIRLGKDGVLVRRGPQSGVFLPQVALETGWDLERFLNELCTHKAGLPSRAWEDSQTELFRFSAEVFHE